MLALPVTMSSGANAMSTADYPLLSMSSAPAHAFVNGGENKPDLHLIKQVEQVTMLGLEGPARRFARIRRMEIR
jgi:hypothetical protein